MNNDVLYLILCLVVVAGFVLVLIFWTRASSKMISQNVPGLKGIYNPAELNQRCSDGSGPNITPSILLPGYATPGPCTSGYRCVKLDPLDPYGYCKAKIDTPCKTIYDCAPIQSPYGLTGPTGTNPGLLGEVFCNGVCSSREYGNVLENCDQTFFPCDKSQGLVCNNVTTIPTNTCFNNYGKECFTDLECPGGVCGKGIDDENKVCYCPGLSNPVNTQICMFLDGAYCQYDQECYGGICFKDSNGVSKCRSRFLPGKECTDTITSGNACLNDYICITSDKELGGICQPVTSKKPSPTGPNTNAVGSFCTPFNVFTGITPSGTLTGPSSIYPILTCDVGLECNYDLTTRNPPNPIPSGYLEGLGTCIVPKAKIGQTCSKSTGCFYPGVCMAKNGLEVCSRPQYFIEGDDMYIYITNDTSLNYLNSYSGDLVLAYPEIKTGGYNTLSIQMCGGGGGGSFGYPGSGNAPIPNYGGGGGGSGQVVGYIAPPNIFQGGTGVTGPGFPTFYYTDVNENQVYPTYVEIDLTKYNWIEMLVSIGDGGAGGTITDVNTYTQAGTGGNTSFSLGDDKDNTLLQLTAAGGSPGYGPYAGSTILNGAGGNGYNGGGAGAGGNVNTPLCQGGSGNTSYGGSNGENTTLSNMSESEGGDGGGNGGGSGGHSSILISAGSAAGGGGGAGGCVLLKEMFTQKILNTGGNGASLVPAYPTDPITPMISVQSTPGVDYTGGGGGGGAAIALTGNTIQSNYGSNGGKGYAIFKFTKVKKDINYVGNQQDEQFPPAGSSGKCAEGYTPNIFHSIAQDNGNPEYCIPNKGYTCNRFNSRDPLGTLCMSANGQSAFGECGSHYKLGIYIPAPPSSGRTIASTISFFGKWHYANLPGLFKTEDMTEPVISVFQVENPLEPFFPITKIIFAPVTLNLNLPIPSTYFYYAEFNTKEISPNNPFSKTDIILQWKKINIAPQGSSRTLNFLQDIKFTASGNIGIIVNETATLKFPYDIGNTSGTSTAPNAYNRVYLCDISDLSLTNNTLDYPLGSYVGPMYIDGINKVENRDIGPFNQDGTSSPEMKTMFMNDRNLLAFGKFMWDIDDKYDSAFSIGFYNKLQPATEFVIFSMTFTPGTFNNITILADNSPIENGINFIDFTNIPRNLKYYVNPLISSSKKLIWNTLYPTLHDTVVNAIVFNDPSSSTTSTYSLILEEPTQNISIQWNFNAMNTIQNFGFYYAVTGDQYKYVNAGYNPIKKIISSQEFQLQGYAPTFITENVDPALSVDLIYRIIGMGNLDSSMYTLVQTCQ